MPKHPRFLLVNYEYPPVGGGGGNATQQIGRALVERGARVTVLTAAQGDLPRRENDRGVQVYRIWAARQRQDRCSIPEMLIFLAHALITAPGLARQVRADAALVFFSLPTGPVAATFAGLQRFPEETMRGEEMFGPALEVANDADEQTKMLSFAGRAV